MIRNLRAAIAVPFIVVAGCFLLVSVTMIATAGFVTGEPE